MSHRLLECIGLPCMCRKEQQAAFYERINHVNFKPYAWPGVDTAACATDGDVNTPQPLESYGTTETTQQAAVAPEVAEQAAKEAPSDAQQHAHVSEEAPMAGVHTPQLEAPSVHDDGTKKRRREPTEPPSHARKRSKGAVASGKLTDLTQLLHAMQAAAGACDGALVGALPGWTFCIRPADTESGAMRDHLMASLDMELSAASKQYHVLTDKTRPEKRKSVAGKARTLGALVAVHNSLWPRKEDAGPPLDDRMYYVVYVKNTKVFYAYADTLQAAAETDAKQVMLLSKPPVVVLSLGLAGGPGLTPGAISALVTSDPNCEESC